MGRLRLSDAVTITLSGPYADAAERMQRTIDEDQSRGSYGHTWEIAWGIVQSGLEWEGWERYHERFRATYLRQLAGKPEHRDAVHDTEEERKKSMWAHHGIAQSMVRNHYMPEGVQLPEFVEGTAARPSVLRMTLERVGMPEELGREWFLRSFASRRVQRGRNYDFTDAAWRVMRDRGLVVGCDQIPLHVAVRILPFADMRSVIKHLELEPQRTLKTARAAITAAGTEDYGRVVNALISLCGFADFTMVQPPDEIEWMDFQSWRQQIRGMAEAMTDLSVGQVRSAFDRSLLKDT